MMCRWTSRVGAPCALSVHTGPHRFYTTSRRKHIDLPDTECVYHCPECGNRVCQACADVKDVLR